MEEYDAKETRLTSSCTMIAKKHANKITRDVNDIEIREYDRKLGLKLYFSTHINCEQRCGAPSADRRV